MITPTVGFVVYGVHKDGLQDPMGRPFIDDALVARSRAALEAAGVRLVEHPVVVASKAEARAALAEMKNDDRVDCVVLFSGTWVWAAHLVAAVRDFQAGGKAVLIWTHPGSQGWRPVGGLVMHGALLEVGIPHNFVYGAADDPAEVARIVTLLPGGPSEEPAEHVHHRRLRRPRHGADLRRGRSLPVDAHLRRRHRLPRHHRAASRRAQGHAGGAGPGPGAAHGAAVRQGARNAPRSTSAPSGSTWPSRRSWRRRGATSTPSSPSRGWATTTSATCFAQSMMLEDGYGTSTLGDFNTALTVLLLTNLSAEPVYYGDLQHIDKRSGEIKIIGDGACPPPWPGSSARPDSPSTASPPRARRAGCR